MNYRKLGKTGLDVSEIALGGGQLHRSPPKAVLAVIEEALERGINYIDLSLPFQADRDLVTLGKALRGRREKALLAFHLETGVRLTPSMNLPPQAREGSECEKKFAANLLRLQTDYADVAFISHVDEEPVYQAVTRPGGTLELALRLKQEGKTRFIGMSCHKVPTALKAAESGHFDPLMFPINPAFDAMPLDAGLGETTGLLVSGRRAQGAAGPPPKDPRKGLYQMCAARGIGLVAMKPFFGGWVFQDTRLALTAVQCLSYALSQPGVSTVAAGVKDLKQLRAALAYVEVTDKERDFADAVAETGWNPQGNCLYCSHCLPCPAGIGIAEVMRLLDTAKHGPSRGLRSQYRALRAPASACTECEVCEERCPFDVAVIEKMRQAAALFESRH